MYRYNDIDRRIVRERVAQFRDQTRRHLAGELSADEFRPLRLQNGLYVEKHNPMLRIAIPYGQLSSKQLRALARVTRTYDRGTGHFSTRHNLQLNWVRVDQVPDILAELAKVDMHAIQTSGACIRNITTDPLAGVSPREVADPRPWAEILRQWSTLHPEFAWLPRKFKVAISGGPDDAAGVRVHDLGLQLVRNAVGELGFRVFVGGGLGRTPILGKLLKDFLPWRHLLTYAEAILRVYNLHGRRDNLYKARIKILVQALGVEAFGRQVEEEWAHLQGGPSTLTEQEAARVATHFEAPDYEVLPKLDAGFEFARRHDAEFAAWTLRNVHEHKMPGYAAVTLSLKAPAQAPGDATAAQMEAVADLADRFGFAEIRTSQAQNLILPDVKKRDLFNLWQLARNAGLATPNIGLLSDVIACPGGDLCSLANARSLPLAAAIQDRFADRERLADIGELRLNISGCVNACGHHHVGHIGVLGIDKAGEERYQITLGGAFGLEASIGGVIGPSFAAAEVPAVIERLVENYRMCRRPHERFIDTLHRVGPESFRAAAYETNTESTESTEIEREVANG
ncbi:MAG: nitrite/sulfite reductase [Sterolibacteriaceae bacterium MAG5]|nr:nitrite/sulfite reductase [Candidatus Nitricoxidireducens bremensis]